MRFTELFKNLGSRAANFLTGKSKRYIGFLPGRLPSNPAHWGMGDFLNAHDISLYTNKAISKRAEKVGEIEFKLTKPNGDTVENNPLLNLLYRPNKIFTGRQFWSLYQKYLDTTGEAYIFIERGREILETRSKPIGLHLLRSDLVKPILDKQDPSKISHYEFTVNGEKREYAAENIIYVHNPDPRNPLRGQSILKAGVSAIMTETQINAYHSSILENGGKVEGVFKFKSNGPLTEQQLKDIKERYQKEYGSAKKVGLPLFLGGDAEYINLGLTPQELSFLEAKKMTLEDISIMTGVPKAILGSMDDVQYSNAETSIRIFLRETIKPLLVTLTTALDEKLFPGDLNLTFVDPTPEDVEQKIKKIESGIKNYYMTINEARESEGLDPVDGGDDILVPFNLTGLGAEKLTESQKKIRKMKQQGRHPLQDKEVRRIYGEIQVKRLEAREKVFAKTFNRYIKDQKKRLVESMGGEKNFKTKDILEEAFSIGLEVKIGKDLFIPVLTDLMKQAGVDAMELAGSDYEFNFTADMGDFLDKKTDVFLTQINETTFEKLKGEFEQSFAAGEGREGLIRRIGDTYTDIGKARAATIARTEVHAASQFATMEGYKQSGLGIKIWVSVGDEATRDSHQLLDGEERPIDANFSNGLAFPGDPNGPAEEVINCRCQI